MEFQWKGLLNPNLIDIKLIDYSEIKQWKPENLSESEIDDGESYHNSLYSDENGINPRSWHLNSTKPLLDSVFEVVKDGDFIIDYGAGTGGSVVELTKRLERLSLSCTIVLVDPLESWFYKAYNLLKNRPNIFFCRSLSKSAKGKSRFLSMQELIGSNKADIILSSSTLHLIPSSTLEPLFFQFHDSLKEGGHFFWSSGDISSEEVSKDCCLLHDPYRELLRVINESQEYFSWSDKLDKDTYSKLKKETSKVFPISNGINFFEKSLLNAGFKGKVKTDKINKTFEESFLFMKSQRLSRIAGAINDIDYRNRFIKRKLEEVFSLLRKRGCADFKGYNTFWHYGSFQKTA